MRYPCDQECVNVVAEMLEHHAKTNELTEWEVEFCESNEDRKYFTDGQKEVIRKFGTKYDLKSFRP